ncbi:MAG: aminodeoxychorismate synthase component I, partial [Flavobacteriaceae bacterium]
MQRTIRTFSIENIPNLNKKLLSWAQQYETTVWLDSNQYDQSYTSFNSILAVDEFTSIKTDFVNAFDKLKEYQSITQDYLFGYISYDVKNATEHLISQNYDGLNFADLYFFQPQKILFIKNNTIEFHYLSMVDDEI